MVPILSLGQLTHLFIEGLKESIKAQVKPFEPQNLEEAISKAKKAESNMIKERTNGLLTTISQQGETSKQSNQGRPCYICHEPWSRGH